MKAKLIKHSHSYALLLNEKLVAFAHPEDFTKYMVIGKLSLKNCQSIERGFDLDDLIDLELPLDGTTGNISQRRGFKKGFEKALELLGNKMFSEEDIHKAFHLGERGDRYDLGDLLESQKITEWDVDIIMDIVDDGLDEGGNPFNSQAKLDPDGCLILKIAK
jgi:hypothetical protein